MNFKNLIYEVVKSFEKNHRFYLAKEFMIGKSALITAAVGGLLLYGCVSQITVVEKKQRDDHKQKEIQIDRKKDSIRNH